MKVVIKLLYAVALLAVLQSCAVMIGGTTDTRFYAKTPSTKISLLATNVDTLGAYKKVGSDSARCRLNNSKEYFVKQEKEGYKSTITPLSPSSSNPGKMLGYAVALGVDVLFLASGSLDLDEDAEISVRIPLFILGVVGWKIFPYGPKLKYEKKYDLPELSPLPKWDENQKRLFVDQASIKIDANQLETNYYRNYQEYQNGYRWYGNSGGKGINYENSVFSNDLNKLLVKYQYCDTTKKIQFNSYNSIKLRTTITAMSSNIVGKQFFVNLTCKWSLYDYFDKEEKFSDLITTGSYWIPNTVPTDDEMHDLALDALENSLIDFLANEELKKFLDNGIKEHDKSFATWEEIKVPLNDSVSTVAEAVRSVVTIKNKEGHGSGCLISNEGWIITNYHVSGDTASRLEVLFEDGSKDTAKVVRVNAVYDLALLKTNACSLKPLKISGSKSIEVGSEVFAIGTPKDIDLGQTVSKGIISGKRKIEDKIYIQTDVSINSGNSGGALITKDGILIGIVNAKLVGLGVEGIGFVIPAYYIEEALKVSLKR